MKRYIFLLSVAGLFIIIFLFYRYWLTITPLSAGDWSFHFPEEVIHFFVHPSSWIFWFHGGLGGNGISFVGLETYFLATARLFYTLTGLNWIWSERVIWYIPFLLVSIYSSASLILTISPTLILWWFSPIIFLTNTYILMVVGGGQMGIAMAYALGPLVLAQFIKLVHDLTFRRAIITGLVLSIMILFDPRIAYVLVLGIIVFWGISTVFEKTAHIRYIYFLGIPFVVAGLVHAFWILPLIIFQVNPVESLGAAYSSIASVKFFSFADFSHALTLLHPNWPENLFGKVYFLQPEFLMIPILAWSTFLWKRRTSLSIISLGLIALLGIFLSKGANDPGGSIYLWLFRYVPGFNVFRDPTKFYFLTSIAYSNLIPIALDQVMNKLPRGVFWKALPGLIFVLFWIFVIRQSVSGQLGGTFAFHKVPNDYEVLKDVINQPEYFRTFWVPHVQRYGFSTYMHPAIDASLVLDTSTPSAMLAWLGSKEGIEALSRWSVKYVILPYDSHGEIFLDDRKYNDKQRNVFQEFLDTNPNINKTLISGISPKLSVYETFEHMDHLWLEEFTALRLSWNMKNPTSYIFTKPATTLPVHLVFSEAFDPHWQVRVGNQEISSVKTKDNLNRFILPAGSTESGTLQYEPQVYVDYGLWVSSVVLLLAFIVIIMS